MTKESFIPIPPWAAGWSTRVQSSNGSASVTYTADQGIVIAFPGDKERREENQDWKGDHCIVFMTAKMVRDTNDVASWLLTVTGKRGPFSAMASAELPVNTTDRAFQAVRRRLCTSVGNSIEATARTPFLALPQTPAAP